MERGPSTLAAALPCVPRGNCALTTGTNYREEIRIRFSSGAYRWMLSRASPLYDSSTGAISGWLGIVSDIQESKENEERLVEQANFTNRFLDSSEDCIEVLDLDGNIVAIINPGRRLLKIPDTIDPRGTFSPEWWSEPQHQQAAQHALEAARRGETERFAGMMEIEGRRRWLDAVAWSILGETGLPERVLMVSRDITEKRHADKALERVHKASCCSHEPEPRSEPTTIGSRVRTSRGQASMASRSVAPSISSTSPEAGNGSSRTRTFTLPIRTRPLQPESTIVFYTDGLVEATRNFDAGLQYVVAGGEAGDDIAVLVARKHATSAEQSESDSGEVTRLCRSRLGRVIGDRGPRSNQRASSYRRVRDLRRYRATDDA